MCVYTIVIMQFFLLVNKVKLLTALPRSTAPLQHASMRVLTRTYMLHCPREVGRIPVLWLQRVPTGGIWRARVETQPSFQSWVSLQAPRVLRLRLSLSLSSSWKTSHMHMHSKQLGLWSAHELICACGLFNVVT